jgi:formylglycine-generating enzyme required for sulfatase activity
MAGSRFARIPEGWFRMGNDLGRPDERPAHRVWIDAFELAIHPVTRGEYAAFLDATGHEEPRDWTLPALADPALPAVGASWNDAIAYCAWYSERHPAVRLPSEAEWERAARGGREDEPNPWGRAIPAWIPNGGRGPLEAPWPVSLGEPNAYGLFGITANIHEWCADWHAPDYYATSDERNPRGPVEGTRRASRGGAWRHAVTICRTSARSSLDPSFRYNDYGFRLARSRPAGARP